MARMLLDAVDTDRERFEYFDAKLIARITKRSTWSDPRAQARRHGRRIRGADGAFTAQEMAERIRDERRASAYRRLLTSEEAEAEAGTVYNMVLRRRPQGHGAARAAAEEARRRTAEYLLHHKLGQLQTLRARVAAGRTPRRGTS